MRVVALRKFSSKIQEFYLTTNAVKSFSFSLFVSKDIILDTVAVINADDSSYNLYTLADSIGNNFCKL